MAKITRKTAVIFGSSAATNQIAQFGSLNAGSPQLYSGSTADPATIQNLSNWQTGWFGAVEDVNSPAIEDMNAVHFVNSYQIGYVLQQGVPEWDSGTTYYTNSMVSSSGLIYVSIADTNLNHAVSDTSWWIPGFLSLGAANSAQTQTLNGKTWTFKGATTGTDSVFIQMLGQSNSQGPTEFDMRTASGASVDCFHTVGKSGGTIWGYGFKNSTGAFSISRSATLGTNEALSISTSNAALFSGLLGIGNTSSIAYLTLDTSTVLSGTQQIGVFDHHTITSAATADSYGFVTNMSTQNASFTSTVIAHFAAGSFSKGAAHTITRLINYLATESSSGTNNAMFTDNTSFTGNYSINLASTNAWLISGPATIGAANATSTHTINGKTIQILGPSSGSNSLQFLVSNQSSSAGGTNVYILNANTASNSYTVYDNGAQWSSGIDGAHSNNYSISKSGTLGTSELLKITTAGSVVLNSAALATNATDGFLYIATCAGTPTGVPTTNTGRSAILFDTTNNKFWAYNGAWKGVVLS